MRTPLLLLLLLSFSWAQNISAPILSGPKYAVYIDGAAGWWGEALARSLNVPGYAPKNAYNNVILAFWLPDRAADLASAWASLDDSTKTTYLNAYHNAGIRVTVSAFGSTVNPATQNLDATATANSFAQWIISNRLDGADVDYEDSASFENNIGATWLITFNKVLRAALPSPQYTISHAPQGPYFMDTKYPDGAYNTIHQKAGSGIDWYNVQFYNQDSTTYSTCDTLLVASDGWASNTAVSQLIAKNIPASKIVIGKPIAKTDAYNTGFMSSSDLAACGKMAKDKGRFGGFMGWQYPSDVNGTWINAIAIENDSATNQPTGSDVLKPTSVKPGIAAAVQLSVAALIMACLLAL
ncbi:hypothetical protein PROFUN_06320 [Planoprotostelium fungivorum]|uniref:GH18 domain-containing protein n=1 Tax=Planoprotostelium fungivorum TaxID=1890364 RepID=A0A2P6NP55_9EUKA|nr:hypothetical protein PROFUN_06320 [Planoprotostelium fungivorum]